MDQEMKEKLIAFLNDEERKERDVLSVVRDFFFSYPIVYNIHIIVIESGFVYIGYPKAFECPVLGRSMLVVNSYNIRKWGTTKGLGQLANTGKTDETVVDFVGTITVPIGKVNHMITCLPKPIESFGYPATRE